jgi:hypothetical protein
MRKAFVALCVGLAIFCGGLQAARADSALPREYLIKAAFLYNFAKFIQWPDAAFYGPQTPFKIAVIGDVDFGAALATIQNKTINSRRIVIDQLEATNGLEQYHLVFLSRSQMENIDQILSQLDGKPVLTISDAKDFSRMGGIIQLYEKDNKIRFNVNMEPAERSQLKISSKLLKLAQVVERQTSEKSVNGNAQ